LEGLDLNKEIKENETKTRIINAARKLFSEKGFDGVSMEDIAQASGVRKSLIYYYFPSKEVLFEEIWINVIDELENDIFSEVEGESNIARSIKKLIKKYIEFVMNKSEISKLIARERMNVLDGDSQLDNAKLKYVGLMKRIENVFEKGKQEDVLNDIEPSAATEMISTVDSIHKKSVLKNIEEFLMKVILKEKIEH
jgi:AcrR family transcriptional regulator